MRALLLALAATFSLAAAAPAVSQSVGMRATPNLNLAGFSGDAHALPSAVATIEQLSGGRVAEIRYDNVAGVPGYDVVLVQEDHVRFQRYTKPSDKPVELTEAKTPKWMLGWQSQKNASLVQDAKVPLADAIRTAEARMKGAPAVAAGISHSAAAPTTDIHAYNVAILQNGRQQRVAINSESGHVISNPSALPGW